MSRQTRPKGVCGMRDVCTMCMFKIEKRDAKAEQPLLYDDIHLDFLCFFLCSISWLVLGFRHPLVPPFTISD